MCLLHAWIGNNLPWKGTLFLIPLPLNHQGNPESFISKNTSEITWKELKQDNNKCMMWIDARQYISKEKIKLSQRSKIPEYNGCQDQPVPFVLETLLSKSDTLLRVVSC